MLVGSHTQGAPGSQARIPTRETGILGGTIGFGSI